MPRTNLCPTDPFFFPKFSGRPTPFLRGHACAFRHHPRAIASASPELSQFAADESEYMTCPSTPSALSPPVHLSPTLCDTPSMRLFLCAGIGGVAEPSVAARPLRWARWLLVEADRRSCGVRCYSRLRPGSVNPGGCIPMDSLVSVYWLGPTAICLHAPVTALGRAAWLYPEIWMVRPLARARPAPRCGFGSQFVCSTSG